jgi:hypothetical protein
MKKNENLPFPYNSRCNYVVYGSIFGADSVLLDNIKVKMFEITPDLPQQTIFRDSCISNKNGFYEVKNMNVIPFVSDTYELRLSAVGERERTYKDTTLLIKFTKNREDFEEGDNENFLGTGYWKIDIKLD